ASRSVRLGVRLPIRRASARNLRQVGQAPRGEPGMVERARETILVVDDDRGPRESLRMILSPSFRVLTAGNAIDALAILRRERVDGGAARAEAEELRTIDFLEVLAETIETKGQFMRGHARRVSFYAGLLAERLGLFGKEQEQVRIAAFLHDLGKVGVPSELLL